MRAAPAGRDDFFFLDMQPANCAADLASFQGIHQFRETHLSDCTNRKIVQKERGGTLGLSCTRMRPLP
ncbi:hypothetical protein [Melaminivora jejuensis]|uniref:hypothetical protein n=1 Tax=Melaminivora jejuensis TaxID=1267217 RepID=UPI001ADFC797|nr:hypothetical protein [Melaminivora jejuensis]UHJ65914.1 hypothetical protein LVC68_05210 [Melaminivora jejuensis]